MANRFRLSTVIIGTFVLSTIATVAIVLAFSVFDGQEDSAQLVKWGGQAEITIEEIVNHVETERRRPPSLEGSFAPASVGEKLIPGDGVKTYRDSEARVDISFNSASGAVASRITRTTPNTVWRLGNFAIEDDTIIELEKGKLFLIEDTKGEAARPIKIVTPAGTASPRGTWLSVQYDANEGVVEVQCFRGSCELEKGFGKQIMTDEEKSAATAKSAPSIPVLMTKSELIGFAGLPEALSGEIAIPPIRALPISTVSISITADEPAKDTVIDVVKVVIEDRAYLTVPQKPVVVFEPTATPRPRPSPVAIVAPVPTATPAPTPTQPPPTPVILPTVTPVPIPLPAKVKSAVPHALLVIATINGDPAPDGTLVSAWMKAYREPLAQGVLEDGQLLLMLPQYGGVSLAGETIYFKIGNLDAGETAIRNPGSAEMLDITAFD